MPVMIGGSLHVSILISVQTKRLNRTPGNASQTLSLVNILNKDRSLFAVRLDLRRNDRRRFAFYQRDGSGQTFPFLLGNECQVIENVDQVNSPKRILGRFAGN